MVPDEGAGVSHIGIVNSDGVIEFLEVVWFEPVIVVKVGDEVMVGVKPPITVGFGAEVLKSQFPTFPPKVKFCASTPQELNISTPINDAVPRFTVRFSVL